ncbi:phosphoribosyltransferase [Hyphococcus sp.]|uniref:phosphoribosyltransferase n=1 Tax=Hyphococcus sp. TaxID=2038636 RepID=UPI0035C6DAAE
MFRDRREAGRQLAEKLLSFAKAEPIVYALPRGGLPVADEVAKRLDAPLDLILVRKLGAPGHEELAIGALVDGAAPTTILHQDVIAELNVPDAYIQSVETDALAEIERRRKLYMKDQPPLPAKDRTAIIVDDGLATGATMEAAVAAMCKAGAAQIIVAVPVAPRDTIEKLEKIADDVIALETPYPFWSVGSWYQSFPQLTDEDVIETLAHRHAEDAS